MNKMRSRKPCMWPFRSLRRKGGPKQVESYSRGFLIKFRLKSRSRTSFVIVVEIVRYLCYFFTSIPIRRKYIYLELGNLHVSRHSKAQQVECNSRVTYRIRFCISFVESEGWLKESDSASFCCKLKSDVLSRIGNQHCRILANCWQTPFFRRVRRKAGLTRSNVTHEVDRLSREQYSDWKLQAGLVS